jgi:hypothetical protein
LPAGDGRFDGAPQFRIVQRGVVQQHPEVEEVLHAAVGHTQNCHGVQLLGDDGGLGVGTQRRCGNIGQQGRIRDRLRSGRDRIAEADVDLQGQARAVEGGTQIDAYAAVAGVLANRGACGRLGDEHDAVVHRDAADGSKDADQRGHVVGAEPQQVGVACRPVRLAIPELEQQRALEQEVRCVLGDGQPVQ